MSKSTEWRCPYCDALNDWQDLSCQICGDGRRDMVETKEEWSENTAQSEQSKKPEESPWQYRQTLTSEDSGQKAKAQTGSQPKLQPKPQPKPTPKPQPKSVQPEKNHSVLKWIAAIILIFLALNVGSTVKKAYEPVAKMDMLLLEQSPPGGTVSEMTAWAKEKGYEAMSEEEANARGFDPNGAVFTGPDYYIVTDGSPWIAHLPKEIQLEKEAEERLEPIEYYVRNDGANIDVLYELVDRKLQKNNWIKIADEEPIPWWKLLLNINTGTKDGERLSLWKDERGSYYVLWKTGEPPEKKKESDMPVIIDSSEEPGIGIAKLKAAETDTEQEDSILERDIQMLINQPSVEEGRHQVCVTEYTIADVARLKEKIEEITGRPMESSAAVTLLGGMGGSYEYYVETENNELYIHIANWGVNLDIRAKGTHEEEEE